MAEGPPFGRDRLLSDDGYLQEFLEDYPLYTRFRIDPWWFKYDDGAWQSVASHVDIECVRCRQVRTFQAEPKACRSVVRGPKSGDHVFRYVATCAACSSVFTCWIEFNKKDEWVRKVGQTPAWSVSIASDLEELLGHRIDRGANLVFGMHGSDKESKSRGLLFDGGINDWLDVDSSLIKAS